ncbi:hypothetical protein A2U01_0073993, partial [Trifolium medium]|nr:hypothetical protein [Trifolium medium]
MLMQVLPPARRAEEGWRAAPSSAEELESFCHLRVAQGGRRVAPVNWILHQG